MQDWETLQMRYAAAMAAQDLDGHSLDYGKLSNHQKHLKMLAEMSNSAITVFDHHKKSHVFASYNLNAMLGIPAEQEDHADISELIHPEDRLPLMALAVNAFEFMMNVDLAVKADYKLVTEFRLMGREGKYISVVEQHQVLELDVKGNFWLSLSILDFSPRQEAALGVTATLMNFRTGEVVAFQAESGAKSMGDRQMLSGREMEILQLIKNGHLSKEISEMLCISVHTVNTHRQRILEKLSVANSMEAVQLAQRLGLLD